MQEGKRFRHLWLFQFLADLVAVIGAYYTAVMIRVYSEWGERLVATVNHVLGVREGEDLGVRFLNFYLEGAPRILLIVTATVCVLYALLDLYPGRRFIRRRPTAWSIIVANLAALALFYGYFYLSRNVFHPRTFFAMLVVLNIVYCIAFRGLLDGVLRRLRRRRGMDLWPALLIGTGEDADSIRKYVDTVNPHGIRITARVEFDSGRPFQSLVSAIRDKVGQGDIAMVICADRRLTVAQIMSLLEEGDRMGVAVKVLSDKLDILLTRAGIATDLIRGTPLVHFEAPATAPGSGLVRRSVYRVLTVPLLLLLSPVFGTIALLIRLTSAGPAFFIQERIGVNRRPFAMFKFRTMRHRADELQAQVEEFNESGGGLFKMREDPRVTKIGRFLRRFSLDELPQLLNVIRGEMTLVGPRPLPRRDFENYYEEWHYSRHGGLPGLTCLWQVSGRSEIDFHNMCILDVFYLRNQNWALDVKILMKTLWVVLFAKGAY